MSQLTTTGFWSDVLDRAFRQAIQVLIPLLTLSAATGQIRTMDLAAVAVAAVVAFAVVVLRALTGLRVEGGSWTVQVADRAVSAAAAAVLAVVAADGFDLLSADWQAIGLSAGLSAVLAVAQGYLAPPADAASVDTLSRAL